MILEPPIWMKLSEWFGLGIVMFIVAMPFVRWQLAAYLGYAGNIGALLLFRAPLAIGLSYLAIGFVGALVLILWLIISPSRRIVPDSEYMTMEDVAHWVEDNEE